MSDEQPTITYPHLRQVQRIVWSAHCPLSPHARALAAYLLNRMNPSYEDAFPSVDRIAAETGWNRKTVMKYTAEICDSGLFNRKPGRKGMYTYWLTNRGEIGDILEVKLAEYVHDFWESNRKAIGPSQGPVPPADRSAPGTGTSPSQGLQSVPPRDPYRLRVKAPVKGPPPTAVGGENEGLKPAVQLPEAELTTLEKDSGGSRGGCDIDDCIPRVEVGVGTRVPKGYAQAVWFDRVMGRLVIVNDERGRAYYGQLREEYDPETIKRGMVAAGAKAAGVRRPAEARNGALEALVRTYCGYDAQKQEATAQRIERPEFKGGSFVPVAR